MNKPARHWLFVAVALAALIGGYVLHATTGRGAIDIRPLMAVPMPDLDGKSRKVGDWAGKVLVVNFWATWCPPCLKEIPEFVRMQERLAARGVQFIGIAADQPEKVREFAAKMQINYPVLLGEMDVIEIARLAGNEVGGLPFTVVLDRRGHWVRSESGALDEARLTEILAPLL
jgi:thiol-disulfide isomerase/thioredoxin